MKRVDQITTGLDPSKALSTGFAAPKQRTGPEADAMDILFAQIALEWREFITWLSDDDLTRMKSMWINGLAKYDQATRNEALGKAIKEPNAVQSKRGPTLGEFIRLCKTEHRPELSWKQRLLPAPEAKKEVVQTEMDKMRVMLGIQTTTTTK